MTSEDVINRLAELFAIYGVPECIRSDNGPEFIAKAIGRWLAMLEVKTPYVEPRSPWQNGYAESFHSQLRDELLNVEEFSRGCVTPRPTRRPGERTTTTPGRTARWAGY